MPLVNVFKELAKTLKKKRRRRLTKKASLKANRYYWIGILRLQKEAISLTSRLSEKLPNIRRLCLNFLAERVLQGALHADFLHRDQPRILNHHFIWTLNGSVLDIVTFVPLFAGKLGCSSLRGRIRAIHDWGNGKLISKSRQNNYLKRKSRDVYGNRERHEQQEWIPTRRFNFSSIQSNLDFSRMLPLRDIKQRCLLVRFGMLHQIEDPLGVCNF